MTTEEQLKTYAAYLPYGLQAKLNSKGIFNLDREYPDPAFSRLGTINSYQVYDGNISGSIWISDRMSVDFESADEIDIALWDLSYLTKEIEHEGRVFIPIDVFEITDDSDSYSIEYDHGNIKLIRDLKSIAENNLYFDIQFLPFEVVQRLIFWHFNVFNLPAGEFIPKTLKTESND